MNNDILTINTNYKRNIGYQFFSLCHKLLALIVIAWLSNGLFTYIMPYYPNFLRWGTFAIWFFIALLFKPKFTKIFFTQTWPLLLFITYIYLVSFFTDYSYIFVYTNNITYLIMIYAIFLFYFDKYYEKFIKLVVIFMSVDILFVAINTYLKLLENPLLSRYLSAGSETRELLLSKETFQAVGNYGYFYGLVPIILLLTYLLLNYRINRLLILIPLIGVLSY